MLRDEVLAVVVSFEGHDRLVDTVAALLPQVAAVHVVDNGSGEATQAVLGALARDARVTVERLATNRGIAAALNRGLAAARARDLRWLLTMDQDSVAAPDLVAAFGRALETEPALTCLAPVAEGGAYRHRTGEDRDVSYAITSGNLVRVDVAAAVAGWDEGLFIDAVDFDFCLRLRRAGHRVRRVSAARIGHRLGEPRDVPRWARPFYAMHGPARRYYQYRNFMYLAERHALRFPGFVLRLGALQLVLLPLIGLFDRAPWQSYREVIRGVAHWAARRRGPLRPAGTAGAATGAPAR